MKWASAPAWVGAKTESTNAAGSGTPRSWTTIQTASSAWARLPTGSSTRALTTSLFPPLFSLPILTELPAWVIVTRYQPVRRHSRGWRISMAWMRPGGIVWFRESVRPLRMRIPSGLAAAVKANSALKRPHSTDPEATTSGTTANSDGAATAPRAAIAHADAATTATRTTSRTIIGTVSRSEPISGPAPTS